MKKFLATAITLCLLMISPSAYGQAEPSAETLPPLAPPLVREGDFATKLVSALEVGTAKSETEAEAMLASAGIAPKNGWISDYPVTPDIIGELQDAVAAAADSERLTLNKYEALEALEIVTADLGLSVVVDASVDYADSPPPASSQYAEPTVVNNYYYTHGPPVVTYYPPPPDYVYLYNWVPYPFWYSGSIFRGFFILNDFHKASIVHKRVVVVTNHWYHRQHRRFFKVDPIKRPRGKSLRAVVERPGRRAFATAKARRGARSILQRSRERSRSWRGRTHGTSVASKSDSIHAGRIRSDRRPAATAEARRSPRSTLQRNRDRVRSSKRPGAGNSAIAKPGRSSSGPSRAERGRNTLAFKDGAGERAQIARQENFKAGPKRPGRFYSAPAGSGLRSSGLPYKGSKSFSGDFHRGSSGISKYPQKSTSWRSRNRRIP